MKLKNRKRIFLIVAFVLVIGGVIGFTNFNRTSKIERILKTESYAYLPKVAQDYIKEVYEETGEVILTEKNKEENVPYLNPQYVAYLQLSSEQNKNVSLIPNPYSVDYVFASTSASASQEFPKSYNLENVDGKNYTSPMYNQGNLGTCWAFATIENAESYLMIKKNEPQNENSTKFSVRQLDYAASTDGIKDYENPWGVAPLGQGGNFIYATTLMANGLSLVDDDYMPYVETLNEKPLHEIHNYNNSLYELNSTVNLPNFGRIDAKVTEQCMNADDWEVCYDEKTEELIQTYINIIKEGIINYGGIYLGAYDPTGSCGALNSDGYYVLDPNNTCFPMNSTAPAEEAHGMQIIGWDDNYEYSYCKKRNHSSTVDGKCESGILTQGTGAWLVKNSWGENNTPYSYLTYDSIRSNFVDFAFITSLSEMSEKNWDNVYNSGKISSIITSKLTQTFNKKFFNEEKIQKIKFHTVLMNQQYSISVKVNGNTYLVTDSFQTKYPGLYTVDVSDKDIIIESGDFDVIITGTEQSINKNSISVFTKNMDSNQYIFTEEKDVESNKFILYSETRNIPSNTEIEYELYKGNEKLENVMEVNNNIVAANNINAEITLIKKLEPGTYRLVQKTNDIKFNTNLNIGTILDGAGTEDNPFKIYTEEDLKYIHTHLDSYYKLENDIELTSEWVPIGTEDNPFNGAFDGNNHKIINLQIDDSTLEYAGLFGYVKDSDEHQTYIKNVYLVNPNIVADYYAGGLIGYIYITQTGTKSALIDSIYIIGGNIEGKQASGLVANIFGTFNQDLTINNIFSSATIKGKIKSSLIGMHLLGNDTGNNKGVSISNIQNIGVMYDNGVTSLIDANSSVNAYSLSNYISTGYSKKDNSINQFYDTPVHDIDDVDETKGYVLARSDSTYTFPSIIMKVTDITELKNTSKYSDWGDDFNTYWEIKEEDGVTRIPTLKGVDLDYTESIDDINVEFGNDIALSDYISSELITRRLNVTTEDNDIIEISKEYNPSEAYPQEIIISPLKQGTATIHVVSDYDGYEDDVTINVSKTNLTITYHNDLDIAMQTVTNGDTINLTKNTFVKEGYTFAGWNTKADGTGTSYIDEQEVTITDDLNLYAQWIPSEQVISFNANGGTGSMDNQKFYYNVSQEINANSFEKEHYTFKEWNTKADGTGTSYSDKQEISITDNLTLYAQWQVNKYTVTFDANGGTGTMEKQTFTYNVSNKLSGVKFSKDGYKFIEWNTKEDGTGTSYTDEQEISITENLTLYAQWQINKYSVTFDANGGMFVGDKSTIVVDEWEDSKLESLEQPTRQGYTFKGYYTEKTGGTSIASYIAEAGIDQDGLVFYAQWIEKYSYIINKYSYDDNEKYIDKIDINTTVDDFKKNIDLNIGYSIDVSYKTIGGKNLLYTGSKTKIYKNNNLIIEYTNIIRGDVSGDGKINYLDYVNVYNHIQKVKHPELEKKELKNEYLISADMSGEGKISYLDYVQIYNKIKELKGGN